MSDPPAASPAPLIEPHWLLVNTLQAAFLGLWTLLSGIAAIALWPLSPSLMRKLPRALWCPGLLWASGARLEVTGSDALDPARPAVFVANHQSMLDIPVVVRAIPFPVDFVAKSELGRVPFIGGFLKAAGMVLVDRSNRTRAIRQIGRVTALLAEGRHVIAFPEGTRSRDGTIGSFKKGVFVTAIEAGVPVYPVAIHGAVAVLPRDGFRLRPGTVRVHVGEPVGAAAYTVDHRDDLITAVRDRLIADHARLAAEREPGPRA